MATCWHCFQEIETEGVCPYCGYDPSEAADKYPLALQPGSILNGSYIVGRVLGQGGFGITYVAQEHETKKRVAIKEFFPSEMAGRGRDGVSVAPHSGEQRENYAFGKELFLGEAKAQAAFIGDEHIARIFNYFEENGTAYFAMEFVDGPSLGSYIAQHGGRLSPKAAADLLLPVMDSLDRIHAHGLVHRDIAPDNILVSSGDTARLIDFGAARYSTGEKSKSLDVILKHGFAPKEQYMRRGRQGPWTDVYAMAATYYYAITGKVPPQAIERLDNDELIRPSELGVPLGDAAEEVLLKALAINAEDRFRRMGDFRQALSQALTEPAGSARKKDAARGQQSRREPSHAEPRGSAPAGDTAGAEGAARAPGRRRHTPVIIGAALALAAMIGIGALYAARQKPAADTPVQEAAAEEALPAAAEDIQAAEVAEEAPIEDPAADWVDLVKVEADDFGYIAALRRDGHLVVSPRYTNGLEYLSTGKYVDFACGDNILGLLSDGTVEVLGLQTGSQYDVGGWTDITAVAAGRGVCAGLKADGTVVAAWDDSIEASDVSGWRKIVAIRAGDSVLVGLRADGTVVAEGDSLMKNAIQWNYLKNVTDVAVGVNHVAVLLADGTVLASGFGDHLVDWQDIVAIAAGNRCTIGVRRDGTVLFAGDEEFREVENWEGIKAVSASCSHVVGLMTDGRAVAVGDNSNEACRITALPESVPERDTLILQTLPADEEPSYTADPAMAPENPTTPFGMLIWDSAVNGRAYYLHEIIEAVQRTHLTPSNPGASYRRDAYGYEFNFQTVDGLLMEATMLESTTSETYNIAGQLFFFGDQLIQSWMTNWEDKELQAFPGKHATEIYQLYRDAADSGEAPSSWMNSSPVRILGDLRTPEYVDIELDGYQLDHVQPFVLDEPIAVGSSSHVILEVELSDAPENYPYGPHWMLCRDENGTWKTMGSFQVVEKQNNAGKILFRFFPPSDMQELTALSLPIPEKGPAPEGEALKVKFLRTER